MTEGFPSSEIDAGRYPDLRNWVVGSLSGHKKNSDIIFQLCQRTGWDWGQAKRFVEQVTQLDQKEVYKRRMPLHLAIGLFMMVGGAFLFLPAFLNLISLLSELEPPLDLSKIFDIVFMARSGSLMVLSLVTGMGMVVGGGWGVWNAVNSAMTGEGDDLLKSETHR